MTVEQKRPLPIHKIIEIKSKELKRCKLFFSDDLEDLQQEMHLHVQRQMPVYRPSVGPLDRFVWTITRNFTRSLRRTRRAQKRNGGIAPGSLDGSVSHGKNRTVPLCELLASDFKTGQRQEELRLIFNGIRQQLPSEMHKQVLEGMLEERSRHDIATHYKLPRRSVEGCYKLIVLMLEDAGLGREGGAQEP